MGNVDLNFKPSMPVFDANVALGRRHTSRVSVDTTEGTLKAMDRAGIDRALVYAPHAAGYDSQDGNRLLMEMIEGEPRLFPQFACNPTFDDLDSFRAEFRSLGVRSVRMLPSLHEYPFRDWVVKPWLEWLAAEQIPIWLPTNYTSHRKPLNLDPSEVHDTLESNPGVKVVLCDVYYQFAAWVLPLLRSLPNLSVEVSRFVNTDGIPRLIDAVGDRRVLFGSRFPDAAIAPQLYSLHRSGLSQESLEAICAGNLERLLGMGEG